MPYAKIWINCIRMVLTASAVSPSAPAFDVKNAWQKSTEKRANEDISTYPKKSASGLEDATPLLDATRPTDVYTSSRIVQ